MTEHTASTPPFDFWITAIDRLRADRLATALEAEGLTRRDRRLLDAVAAGTPLHSPKLRRLAERGWIARGEDAGSWTLTESGRAAKDRMDATAEGVRAQIAEVVSPEDYAVTVRSLENVARALGWEEGTPLPRRGRRHHGHRDGHGHGHGHHHGDGHGHSHHQGRGFGRGDGRPFEPGFGDGSDGGHGPRFDHDPGFGRDPHFGDDSGCRHDSGFGHRGHGRGHRGHGRAHRGGFGAPQVQHVHIHTHR